MFGCLEKDIGEDWKRMRRSVGHGYIGAFGGNGSPWMGGTAVSSASVGIRLGEARVAVWENGGGQNLGNASRI